MALLIYPSSLSFDSASSTKYVSIGFSSESWMVEIPASDTWVSLSTYTGTSSPSDVAITVTQNTSSTIRASVLTFYELDSFGSIATSVTFTILQEGYTAEASISVDKTNVILDDANATTFTVNVTASLSWITDISQEESFVSISQSGGVSGTYAVTVTVLKNTGSERKATIDFYLVSDSNIIVSTVITQPAASTVPTISISPISLSFDSEASSNTITLNSNSNWGSTITAGSDFISLSDENGESGEYKITVSVKENNTILSRAGSIRFYLIEDVSKYVVVAIDQSAFIANISVSPSIINASHKGGTYSTTIIINTEWTAEIINGSDFISIPVSAGNSGTINFIIFVSENKNASRTGVIRVKSELDSSVYQDIKIYQESTIELEKDGIKISVPEFGWSFNPIIADCVNPNNVKINAVLGEIVELEGDYYTLTSSNATSTSVGYYNLVDGSYQLISNSNYTTYHNIPISTDKGLKMRYVGLVSTEMYFMTHGTGGFNYIKISGSSSNPITNLDITLPAGTTIATVTTSVTVPFTLYVGTFDSSQVISDLSVQVSRIGYNGKTQFDLSGLSRMVFNRDEFYKVEKIDNTLYKNLSVSFSYTVGSSTTSIGSANVKVIWGGLQIGETFSQNRTYRYFKGYPFTIPLYLEESAVLKINDTESETLNPGKYNLDITSDSIVSLFNAYFRKVFTTVFDKTFQPQRILIGKGIEINVEVCDCNLGDTYLRWINTLGEWNYYLFKKTSEVIESEASDIVYEQYYDTVNYVNNHHAGTGQYISKSGTNILNVAAVHLSQDMYDFVRGITLSPIVDLYDNGNWKRVKIGDSDLTKSNRVLQNLEIEVILPDLITQSL